MYIDFGKKFYHKVDAADGRKPPVTVVISQYLYITPTYMIKH